MDILWYNCHSIPIITPARPSCPNNETTTTRSSKPNFILLLYRTKSRRTTQITWAGTKAIVSTKSFFPEYSAILPWQSDDGVAINLCQNLSRASRVGDLLIRYVISNVTDIDTTCLQWIKLWCIGKARLMLYWVWYLYNLNESRFAVLFGYKNSPGYSQVIVIRHTYEIPLGRRRCETGEAPIGV